MELIVSEAKEIQIVRSAIAEGDNSLEVTVWLPGRAGTIRTAEAAARIKIRTATGKTDSEVLQVRTAAGGKPYALWQIAPGWAEKGISEIEIEVFDGEKVWSSRRRAVEIHPGIRVDGEITPEQRREIEQLQDMIPGKLDTYQGVEYAGQVLTVDESGKARPQGRQQGPAGPPGADGKSAYDVAVENGYSGTKAQWLASLKGDTGAPGEDGEDGAPGAEGKSAYELAVEEGYAGTKAQWLASLKGDPGAPGEDGEDGAPGADGKSAYEVAVDEGYSGTKAQWLASLKGADGTTPVKGTDYFTAAEVEQIVEEAAAAVDVPDVPAWAMADSKPSYSAVEVGALADTTKYAGAATAGGPADKAVSIPYGEVDGTSTSTAFTAQIPGITELRHGVRVLLKNGVATSAAGCTLNVNGLGAKPIYQSMAAATAVSTTFNVNYTMEFAYDEDRVAGGCWVMLYGYNANTTYTNASLGQGYATCSTAAATAAKTASLSSYSLTTGGYVAVKFSYDVPASATLNVNSKGAKAMYYRGAAITAGIIKAGDVAVFVYSTYYHLVAIDRWGVDIASLLTSLSTLSGDVSALEDKTTPVTVAMTLDGSGNLSFTWADGLEDFFALYSAGQAVYPALPAAYLFPSDPDYASELLIFSPTGINQGVGTTAVTLSCIHGGSFYWARMAPTSLTTLTGALHVIGDGDGGAY